tara:strand:+ start:192 stop:413 length:222 start_codon:yes stop_codon:yes gene_type:complete
MKIKIQPTDRNPVYWDVLINGKKRGTYMSYEIALSHLHTACTALEAAGFKWGKQEHNGCTIHMLPPEFQPSGK